MSRCDLTGYTAPPSLDCTGCNLSRANLRGANLSGANLTKANGSGIGIPMPLPFIRVCGTSYRTQRHSINTVMV